MQSNLPFVLLSILANVAMIIFVAYYFLELRTKERKINKKASKMDSDYHHIVDDALTKERKILEDAAQEADDIISTTRYLTQNSKESVDLALQKMTVGIEKEAIDTAEEFAKTYQTSLRQVSTQSLTDFQRIVKAMETDLQKQTKEFRESLLPKMEKELDEYKLFRLKETEQTIANVVQKVSQEVLNKAISLDDHHTLMLAALEKAKKEGGFG